MTTSLIKKACQNIGLHFKSIDDDGLFLNIDFGDSKFHLCIANNLGLNNEVVEKICRDKTYTALLLSDCIKMPQTTSYVDSDPPELYSNFKKHSSHQAIIDEIVKKSQFPIILKPNSKSMGTNVFSCNSNLDVVAAVNKIFDRASYQYDHVLLAQKKIDIITEFRVVTYNHQIQFIYKKDNNFEDSTFQGNLSPLHFENAKAVFLTQNENETLYNDIKNFIQPIFGKMPLNYAGLDIALDSSEDLYLLEINSKPGFSFFIKDNGDTEVIKMFEKILIDLKLK
jgi:glutathione synthase/RimK-type ligase-like ATP-grasp enzyme